MRTIFSLSILIIGSLSFSDVRLGATGAKHRERATADGEESAPAWKQLNQSEVAKQDLQRQEKERNADRNYKMLFSYETRRDIESKLTADQIRKLKMSFVDMPPFSFPLPVNGPLNFANTLDKLHSFFKDAPQVRAAYVEALTSMRELYRLMYNDQTNRTGEDFETTARNSPGSIPGQIEHRFKTDDFLKQ